MVTHANDFLFSEEVKQERRCQGNQFRGKNSPLLRRHNGR